MLLIISSDKSYVSDILNKISNKKINNSPPMSEAYECEYNSHKFILLVTGYGKINIGSSLRYIVDKYSIRIILCVGTAGSISDSNKIFSAVIPNSCMQFDVDFTPNGYLPMQVPFIDNYEYKTNEDVNNLLVEVCSNCGNYSKESIASSDMFVNNYRLSNSVRVECESVAIDTESGSVGQFAYLNDIPYSCVKVISNFANNNAIKQYNSYDHEASIMCQKIVYNFIKKFYDE